MAADRPWILVDFDRLPSVYCPCGTSQRALLDAEAFPGSIHRTEIGAEAKPHFHRRHTETYYILACGQDAALELDGQRVAVRPGTCVVIPPNVVHRAVTRMTILNIVIPKFDPADEVVIDD